jgi:hypothetical protein
MERNMPYVFDETDNPDNFMTNEEYTEQVKEMMKVVKKAKKRV